jgi:hypothetical protein
MRFGSADLLLGLDLRLVGAVDDLFAEIDELALDEQVVDQPAVIADIDDADHRGCEFAEITRPADIGQGAVLFEEHPQGDRIGDLVAQDQARQRIVDAAVHRIGEMFGLQEIGDAVEGVVVGEDRAEQGLFGFEIVRRRAEGG